jgi:Esterase PHB depolymerase
MLGQDSGHSRLSTPSRSGTARVNRRLMGVFGGVLGGMVSLVAATAPGMVRPPPGSVTPFDVKGRVARIVVTATEDPPGPAAGSVMLGALDGRGVLAELAPNQSPVLRAAIQKGATHVGPPPGAERWCVVHVIAENETRRVAIERTHDGSSYAAVIDPEADHPLRLELDRARIAELLQGWAMYRGGFEEHDGHERVDPDQRGIVRTLGPPILPGLYWFDVALMTSRVSGARWGHGGAERELKSETFGLRVPKGYSPREPAGVLVWIDPGQRGGPPAFTHQALDELGLIGVGADHAGNGRNIADRFQLAFDAIATVSTRYHVDPRRVYVSGLSGGGRASSMLVGCFPDVFAGAVPIVGLSWCQNVPTGVGKFWPAGFAKPDASRWGLWKQRPIAPITGPKDFNYREIAHAVELMDRAGMRVKLFDVPEMGHQAPSERVFSEALRWVDTAYQTIRTAECEAASKALQKAKAQKTDGARRKFLVQTTKDGPWSPAAWEAVAMLREKPDAPGDNAPAR